MKYDIKVLNLYSFFPSFFYFPPFFLHSFKKFVKVIHAHCKITKQHTMVLCIKEIYLILIFLSISIVFFLLVFPLSLETSVPSFIFSFNF